MSEAQRLLNPEYFIERHYRIKPRGELIRLESWERKIIRDLFPNDNRGPLPFSLFLLSIPKKLGKTEFVTSLICWHLFTGFDDSPGMPLVLFVANSKEQTSILGFEKLVYAIENDEFLSGSCKIYTDRIVTSTGGVARVLSSKSSSAAGGEPSWVFFDEIHSADERMVERLFSELTNPGTRDSIVTIASYAGFSKNTLLYRLLELAESKKDRRFYSYIGHDPYLSRRQGRAEYLESEKLRLLHSEFSRIHLNKHTDSKDIYIPAEDWGACYDGDLQPLAPTKDVRLTLGVDCAARRDTASIIGVYKEDDIVKVGYVQVFKPPKGAGELDLENTVAKTLRFLSESYFVGATNYDERFMVSIAQRLEAEGAGGEWTRVSSQRASMCPIYENLRQGVKRRAIRHFGDKDLDLHVSNAVAEVTSAGIIIGKPNQAQKIDACVALALSAKDLLSGEKKVKIELMRGGDLGTSPKTPTRSGWTQPGRKSLADKMRAMDGPSMADWHSRLRGR